jgi:hypothetical protein
MPLPVSRMGGLVLRKCKSWALSVPCPQLSRSMGCALAYHPRKETRLYRTKYWVFCMTIAFVSCTACAQTSATVRASSWLHTSPPYIVIYE